MAGARESHAPCRYGVSIAERRGGVHVQSAILGRVTGGRRALALENAVGEATLRRGVLRRYVPGEGADAAGI
jgi:hypothetical protein